MNAKRSAILCKLLLALNTTAAVLYFMWVTPSPKIIFVPFLICGIAKSGSYIALLLEKKKMGKICRTMFAVGFLLFWFGFLTVAVYLCIRDKNYALLLFTIPFWWLGIAFAKNRLCGNKSRRIRQNKTKQ